jgi:hypothetical protein
MTRYAFTRNDLNDPAAVERTLKRLFNEVQSDINSTVRGMLTLTRRLNTEVSSVPQINAQLQITGSAPLNVQNLPGELAQPQKAKIPEVDALPDWDDPLAQSGGLVRYQGVLWMFSTAGGEPGEWIVLTTAAIIMEGDRANRPAANSDLDCMIYRVTSWNAEFPTATFDIYWYMQNGVWVLFPYFNTGYMRDTYAGMPDPTHATGVLTAEDDGLPFEATDWDNVRWIFDYPTEEWYYESGTYSAVFASRPLVGTLDAGDDGLLFNATDRDTITWRYDDASESWIYASGTHTDTYANRPLIAAMTAGDDGYLFTASDWGVTWRYNHASTRWDYVSGTRSTNYAGKPAGLGAGDTGLLWYVTDYEHTLIWGGAAWTFIDTDPGSRWFIATAGVAPEGGVFQLCDGSTVACLQTDGTTTNVTTPDLTDASESILIAGGTYTGSRVVSTSPTWDAAAVTDDESAHTHDLPFDMHGDDHNEVHWAADNIFGSGAAMTETTRSATTDEAGTGNYALSDAGTAHHHDLSDGVAVINPPSIANGGVPLHVILSWYMRR